MKKYLFLLIIFTTLCFSNGCAQETFTRDQIFEMVKKKAFVDTLKDNICASPQMIPPNTKLHIMNDSIVSPNFNSWFFFIDKVPFAYWTHPCKYVFVNSTDASFIVIEGDKNCSFKVDHLLRQKSTFLDPPPPVFKKYDPKVIQ